MCPNTGSDWAGIRVNRARIVSVDLFEVTEHELELLEKGAASAHFDFALFLMSLAFSSVTSILCTTTFRFGLSEALLTFAAVVASIGGLYCFSKWFRTHKSLASVVGTIRSRMPRNPSKKS